jgi:tRNA threonylcarbamoyladenosine biosynthesis protein TsaE
VPDQTIQQIITHSAEETTQWGREFAKRLTAPVLVLLSGDLGTGKTTLTKGIVAGLGAATEDEVTSPTFTLVHIYGVKSPAASRNASAAQPNPPKVYHADLYRIESFHDFETLGLEDLFDSPSIAIFEWSERFPLKSPWPQIRLRLEHAGGDSRRISLSKNRDSP